MINENQMVVTSQEGEEQVCDILFTHEHNGKNYVVFEFVDSGEVSAAVYQPGEGEDEGEFFDIETDEEWDMLDRVLQAFYDEIEQEVDEEDDEEDSDSK